MNQAENNQSTLYLTALQAFRTHCSNQHYLRLHHAVYLSQIMGQDAHRSYADLQPWMQAALNRFFELVDRVALSACQFGGWEETEIDQILKQGQKWISALMGQKELLVLPYEWGSPRTRRAWGELSSRLDPVLFKHLQGENLYEKSPKQYEIFTGGFEYVPVIGLFPFYLFGERLSAWGIFEYGKVNSLALAMNDRAVTWLATHGFDLKPYGKDGRYEVNASAFPDIMNAARKVSKFYIGPGHAAVSLTSRIVDLGEYWKLRAEIKPLPETTAEQYSGDAANGAKPTNDDEVDVSALREVLRGREPAIVISDLGDLLFSTYLQSYGNDKRPNRVTVTGLKVPVGLGFSLASVPLLLSRRDAVNAILRELRDWASEQRKNKDALLQEDGIELMEAESIPSPWKPEAASPAVAGSK